MLLILTRWVYNAQPPEKAKVNNEKAVTDDTAFLWQQRFTRSNYQAALTDAIQLLTLFSSTSSGKAPPPNTVS